MKVCFVTRSITSGFRLGKARFVACLCMTFAVIAGAGKTALAESGWTDLVPSGDSRIVYVSNSQGSDSNDGLSPQTPVKTIAKGYSLLRNGYPDWLLFRRGDVFTGEPLKIGWNRSGRSANEPMVISSYGSSPDRPKILTPPGGHALTSVNESNKHLRFVGLHLEPHNRTPSHGPTGISWLGSVEDLLIEDCYIGNYQTNIVFQVYSGPIKDIRIRRSVVVDAWSAGSSHSQGMYTKDVQGLLIEENVFDHNGWHPTISGASPTIYNHNMYIQRGNTNVVVRGNIIARGSATGVQLRPGGVAEGNLCIRNPTGILFGQFQNSWPSEGVSGVVRNNVVFDGIDVSSSFPVGRGIWLQQVKQADVYGNVVARQETGTGNLSGLFADYNYQNVMIRDNVVYDWNGGSALRFLGSPHGGIVVKDNLFQQPASNDLVRHQVSLSGFSYSNNTYFSPKSSPFDPGSNFDGWVNQSGESTALWTEVQPTNSCSQAAADLYTYMGCIGYPETYEAFLGEARKQSKTNWRQEFSADEVNGFIRASYNLPKEGL